MNETGKIVVIIIIHRVVVKCVRRNNLRTRRTVSVVIFLYIVHGLLETSLDTVRQPIGLRLG